MGVNRFERFLVDVDKVADYIPLVSTVTNGVDLIEKTALMFEKSEPTQRQDVEVGFNRNYYFTHIKKKSTGRCFLLLIPVVGNLCIGVYDLVKNKSKASSKQPENPLSMTREQKKTEEISKPIIPEKNTEQGINSIDASQWFRDLDSQTKKSEDVTKEPLHRFDDIPCPKSTVVKGEGINGKEQILHANHVKTPDGSNYIATQAPTSDTIELFWLTCMGNDSKLIVDLTNESDRKRDNSVIPYYPEEKARSIQFGQITVTCEEKQEVKDYTIITYTVLNIGKNRKEKITRIHYQSWADHGVTASGNLHKLIEEVNSIAAKGGEPITVHCRAGVGRTGSFITARTLNRLKNNNQLTQANFKQHTQEAILVGRESRGPVYVQTPAQLKGLIDYGEYIFKS